MVKNLPSVERSTKIRFGKHVPDSNDQEENTVVFNASNDTVPTPYSNAVYLSPIRNRTDYTAPEIVLLMYDRNTKEITESGESANALIGGSTLDTVVNRNNATSNVVQLTGVPESLITYGNVGIANTLASHTVSVGSNLYIDDLGSNVLVVSGNVAVLKDMIVEGNLRVNGDTTVIYTENTSIKDAFIELGADNTSGDTTLDLGVLMHRPDVLSNVVIGYREGTDEFAIAYTDAQPTDKTFTPKTDEDINVHVYGLTHVDANIYAHEDVLVDGNVYVSHNVSVTEELTVSGNVYADKDLEVIGNTYVDGNVVAYKDLTLSGNVYVSGNVNVTKQLSVSGNAYVSGNVEVTKSLIVSANTHLKGPNVFVTNTMNFLNPKTAIVTDQVSNVQIRLGQLENVSNTASNPLADQVIMYDGNRWMNTFPNHSFLTIKNAEPTATLVSGNAVYISGYQNQNLARVKLARADSPLTMPAIGIVYGDDIPPDEEGLAAAYGKVNQMNTNGYQVGETLYVSNLYAGWISNVKPYYTDGTPNLIQNVGVVTRKDTNSGAMFVTGIGRANDIPNAQLITDYNDMNYVYVNDVNNDFKKIASPNLNIPLTTAVSSSSNSAANAVTLRGVSITSGGGFHGDLVVAGNVTVDTNTLKVDAEANRVGILTASPGQPLDVRGAANVGTFTTTTGTVTDATHSTSKDTGVLVLTQGGLGVEANIHSTNVFAASHIAVGTSATSNTFDVRGTANVGALVATSTHISDSTAVTSKTTGALQVTGGVGIQGDIHATHANLEDVEADSVNVTDTTAATNKTSGALKVAGGVGIQGDLYATNGVFTTNVYITDHTDLNNKYLAMIDTNGSLIQSPVYVAPSGKYVITAAEAEFLGNITLGGNTTVLTSNSLIVQDRIIAIGSNNSAEGLDSGIIIEHQDDGTFANIALIHHADEHRFSIGYTQNTLTDNHILNAGHPNNVTLRIDLIGNAIVQNSLSVSEMATFSTKVGVATTEPNANIHVVGNVFVTSNISTASNVLITGDAAATSKTTGALQVAGGVGVSGDIYATHANLEDVEADSVTITDSTTSTSTTTGALKVAGGVSTQEKLNVGGVTKIWDSTAVTGKTDGALVVVGGVGISGDIHATHANLEDVEADSVNVTDTTAATNKTSGALQVAGGVGVSGALFGAAATFDGVTSVTNATAATGKTDGALVVTGGVGVSGALYGAAATFDGVTSVTNATAVTGKTDGALVVTGGVGISGDIHATHANLEDVEADSVNVTDTTAATNKTSGALQVVGGVGISGALFGAAATFDGVTSVTNATAVTSKTDGALVVTGGVGISGDIHATHANLEDVEADSVNVTDTTVADSTTTGALTVAGGISTQANLYVGKDTYITSNLNVDTSTLHADSVAGRVGIGKTDPGFTLDVAGDINFSGSLYEGGSLFVSTPWTIETGPDALSYTAGNIGIGVANPPAKLTVQGGTIINSDQVAKKTYSYSGDLASAQTIADSTIKLTFTNHTFSAKVVAHLIESDDEVSTISFECCGGNWSGSTPANNIALGPVGVFGPTSTNPWDSAVTTTTTTVSFKPTTDMAAAGHYNVFVEYFSQNSAGELTSLHEGATAEVSDFGY